MTNEVQTNLFDFEAFSGNEDVQELARESVEHISKLYPIYIMFHYHSGNALTTNQMKYIDLLLDLVNQYEVDITLVLNEQDVQMVKEYDEEHMFKYLVHSCYDSPTELSNNIAKIKNFILKSAASRFGNKNVNWIFLIEEGVLISRALSQDRFVECSSAEDALIALAIWQYLATKKAFSEIKDENNIGLSGIYNSPKCDKSNFGISIDNHLCSKALLLNLSECNRKHIEFDLMNDVLEDIDFNISMFANGLHVVIVHYPLDIKQASYVQEHRSNKKLSNLTINLWAKWGDKVVKNIFVEGEKLKVEYACNFNQIINEYNSSNRHRIIWPKNERLLAEYMEQKKKVHA